MYIYYIYMYERDGTCGDGSVTKRSPNSASDSSLGTPTSSTHRPFTMIICSCA